MISARLSAISWWACFLSKSKLKTVETQLFTHCSHCDAVPEHLPANLYPQQPPSEVRLNSLNIFSWSQFEVTWEKHVNVRRQALGPDTSYFEGVFFRGFPQLFHDGARSVLKLGYFSIVMSFNAMWCKPVVLKMDCTAPWLGGGDAGGEPLWSRCSLIYDWNDFRPDTGKLVSLYPAPSIAFRIYDEWRNYVCHLRHWVVQTVVKKKLALEMSSLNRGERGSGKSLGTTNLSY
jgi:hypothetical protein